MAIRRLSIVLVVFTLLGVAVSQSSLAGQADEVTVKVNAAGDRQVRFRGAVMFKEGGLQMIDGQTPFEVRGRGGVALGMFERLGEGPELRVELSTGAGQAIGAGTRVIVGNDVVRSVTHFARTF